MAKAIKPHVSFHASGQVNVHTPQGKVALTSRGSEVHVQTYENGDREVYWNLWK